jgi:tripartite-type tricarboxylate transporter receptor subunit TctC
MKMSSYPTIGQKVRYVRQDPTTGKSVTGEGQIRSIAVDPDKKLVAFLEGDVERPNEKGELVTTKEKFLVYVSCLNPSEEFIDKFTAGMNKVLEIAQEGNGKSQEIVAEYNQKVDQVKNEFLGQSVVFE